MGVLIANGFQSTHPLRGATEQQEGPAGSDLYFNPRAPCGARQREGQPKEERIIFQSTHPLRGATPHECRAPAGHSDFNPRTPCGVRRSGTRHDGHCPYFNPRTPCGVRPTSPPSAATITYFNPRAPCGARRLPERAHRPHPCISIHAPLAGRDSGDPTHRSAPPYFNPRTPCGVRQSSPSIRFAIFIFQSTHPLRGATRPVYVGNFASFISIHAPLAGCDLGYRPDDRETYVISIHAPLAGCDNRYGAHGHRHTYFNPRTPCGVRPAPGEVWPSSRRISIHAPLAGCDLPRLPWKRK